MAISLADDSKMPNHQLWINKMMITDENIPKAASEAKSAGDTAQHPRRASQTGSRLAEAQFGAREGSDCRDLSIQPETFKQNSAGVLSRGHACECLCLVKGSTYVGRHRRTPIRFPDARTEVALQGSVWLSRRFPSSPTGSAVLCRPGGRETGSRCRLNVLSHVYFSYVYQRWGFSRASFPW